MRRDQAFERGLVALAGGRDSLSSLLGASWARIL